MRAPRSEVGRSFRQQRDVPAGCRASAEGVRREDGWTFSDSGSRTTERCAPVGYLKVSPPRPICAYVRINCAIMCDMNVETLRQLLDDDGSIRLVRTDFSNDAAWQRVVTAVTAEADFEPDDPDSEDGYSPGIEPLEDAAFDGATGETLTATANGETFGFVLIADARSMREAASDGELTVVWLDLSVEADDAEEFGWIFGREFRCLVEEVASIEANLSISNMEFEEFADSAHEDGVFRGFA